MITSYRACPPWRGQHGPSRAAEKKTLTKLIGRRLDELSGALDPRGGRPDTTANQAPTGPTARLTPDQLAARRRADRDRRHARKRRP
jgi:hypothetical protein